MTEIETFTGQELTDDRMSGVLPGWREPGTLPDMLTRMDLHRSFAPVLSVSVFREHPEDLHRIQALTAVRQKSTTHVGVVSTLTSAFPPYAGRELVAEKEGRLADGYPEVAIGTAGPDPSETAVVARYKPNREYLPDAHSLLPYLCHDVFARKLGRPDLINMFSDDDPVGTVSLSRITAGVSYTGETEDEEAGERQWYERLMMFGAAVMLSPEHGHVFDQDVHDRMTSTPPDERRYGSLGWTEDAESFPADVQSRSVIDLAPYVPEMQAVGFCVRGQCLSMTAEIVKGDDLYGHLGRVASGDGSLPNYGLTPKEKLRRARKAGVAFFEAAACDRFVAPLRAERQSDVRA